MDRYKDGLRAALKTVKACEAQADAVYELGVMIREESKTVGFYELALLAATVGLLAGPNATSDVPRSAQSIADRLVSL